MPQLLLRFRLMPLVVAGALATVLLWAARGWNGSDAVSFRAQRPTGTPASVGPEPAMLASDGDRVLDRVLTALEQRPNITARVRQRVYFQGREIAGIGNYWQRGVDRKRRTRWEMQTHAGDGTASFREVLVDGRFLWTERNHETNRSVTRVDLSRLRAALLSRPLPASTAEPLDPDAAILLARGGVSRLIAHLQTQFQFSVVATTGADASQRDILVGRWKSKALESRCPGVTAETLPADWPPQLPHHVVLAIGAKDLFPYVVEYRQAADSATYSFTSGNASARLTRFEFHEVRFDAAIADRRFEYSPPEQWSDATQQTLDQLLSTSRPNLDAAQLPSRREWRR